MPRPGDRLADPLRAKAVGTLWGHAVHNLARRGPGGGTFGRNALSREESEGSRDIGTVRTSLPRWPRGSEAVTAQDTGRGSHP